MTREYFREKIVDDLLSYKNIWGNFVDDPGILRVVNDCSRQSQENTYEYLLCLPCNIALDQGGAVEKVLTTAGNESLYPLARIKINVNTEETEFVRI